MERDHRLPALIGAAKRTLRDAKQKLIPSDLALAEACAELLTKELDIAVETAAIEPQEFTYVPREEPRLIVLQRGKFTRTPRGAMSGYLTVFQVRGRRHREIVGTELLNLLERAGWRFHQHVSEHTLTTPIDGGELDAFEFEVGVAYPSVPVVTGDIDMREVPSAVAGHAAYHLGMLMGEHYRADPLGAAFIVSDTVNGDERTTIVEVAYSLARKVRGVLGNGRYERAALGIVGHVLPIGRVTDVVVIKHGPIHDATGHVVATGGTVRVTAVCKVAA